MFFFFFGYAEGVRRRVTTVRFVLMFQSMELLNINFKKLFQRGGAPKSFTLVRCWLIESA